MVPKRGEYQGQQQQILVSLHFQDKLKLTLHVGFPASPLTRMSVLSFFIEEMHNNETLCCDDSSHELVIVEHKKDGAVENDSICKYKA